MILPFTRRFPLFFATGFVFDRGNFVVSFVYDRGKFIFDRGRFCFDRFGGNNSCWFLNSLVGHLFESVVLPSILLRSLGFGLRFWVLDSIGGLHCKWVDEVIPDAPLVINHEFLDKHNIDDVAHDSLLYADASGAGMGVYEIVKAVGRFKETKRTDEITPLTKFDASEYPVRIAGRIHNFTSEGYIDAEMDLHLDDPWRYCMVAGKKALHFANLSQQLLQSMNKKRMGEVIGTGYGGATSLRRGVEALLIGNEYEKASPFCIPYGMNNVGFALLAMEMGFVVYSISTVCAASNHSFFAAANHIRRGIFTKSVST